MISTRADRSIQVIQNGEYENQPRSGTIHRLNKARAELKQNQDSTPDHTLTGTYCLCFYCTETLNKTQPIVLIFWGCRAWQPAPAAEGSGVTTERLQKFLWYFSISNSSPHSTSYSSQFHFLQVVHVHHACYNRSYYLLRNEKWMYRWVCKVTL